MTVKGIEISGTIYDNEDETARDTATEAASTARAASQTATTANQTATTANQRSVEADTKASENANAITELQSDVENIQAVIPSTATSINKLTTSQDLSGLCSIVTTSHVVQQGFRVNQNNKGAPGVYWSADINPTLPAPNAVLISMSFSNSTWYPNVLPFVRGAGFFNLISFTDFTIPVDITLICVWAIPNS